MSIEIRKFEENDVEKVQEVIHRNFFEVNIRDYTIEEMEELALVYSKEKILDLGKTSHFYVSLTNEVVNGCGAISYLDESKEESILLTVFISPELQGKGIGKEIMKALEEDEIFKNTKITEVHASITACEFYKRLGYTYKNGITEMGPGRHYKLEKLK